MSTIAVLVIVTLAWWWRHPGVLPAAGAADYGMSMTPGQVRYLSLSGPDPDAQAMEVHVDSVRAVPALGPGAGVMVAMTFHVCRPTAGETGMGGGAYTARDVAEQCAELVPAEDATLRHGGGHHDRLLVRFEALPGSVAAGAAVRLDELLDGWDVSYSAGWQDGTQRVGPPLRLVVEDRGR